MYKCYIITRAHYHTVINHRSPIMSKDHKKKEIMKRKNWFSLVALALILSFALSSCYVGYYGPRRGYGGRPHHHHHHGGHYGGGYR